MRTSRRILGSLALVGLTVVYLFLFFGMRIVPDGTGIPKIITFDDPEAHYAQLEQHRAEQQEAAASPAGPQAAPGQPATTIAAHAPEKSALSAEVPARAASHFTGYWTDFRGPGRDGDYDEMPIRTDWPDGRLEPLWKQPVGGGYASFVIAGGRAFTIEQRRDREVVAAYDVATGRELWTNSWRAYFQESMGGDGPRATPTYDEGRVYALGAEGELRAIDAATGTTLWRRNMLSENGAQNLTWGMAATPLIVDEKVIVLPGGRAGRSVVAYHKRTGKLIWAAQNDQQAYTSPMEVTLAGQRQLLVVSAERAMGLRIEDGSLLWDYPWFTQYGINSAQPIRVDEHHFFISAGYGHGAALVRVTRSGDSFRAETVWKNNFMKNKFNSSVLHQGYIYGLDEGILACISARTGERAWKGGRYGYGQVLLADGHLIILSERGELALVRATPEGHHELARFSAIEGKTWNHPAIDNGYLLVRNLREMAAFRIAH